MQVARMKENAPRTLLQKLFEIGIALRLEVQYSKEEILREYLFHAPYGSNIRGYLAASYRFFDKAPNQLSWAQAAMLAVLPNAPGSIFPGKNSDHLQKKRDELLLKLHNKKLIDKETYELSLLEPIPTEIIPFPLSAPHLTERIHLENDLPIVVTTIDPDIQFETNFFLKQHSSQQQQLGIYNACALVINNTSGKVVSYVGSQDFDDFDHWGRVDGVMASRSSGSILKPFLYASAIDEGLILPQTLIKDVPTYFESFSPNNASEQFSGIVPASKALIHSLNIPAVRLLNMYGLDKFYNLLKTGGIQTLFRTPDEYGLPLILGGSEVRPWDIARLYRGLANGGSFSDITYYANQTIEESTPLISSGATYLILDEMKELIRPGLEFYWKRYGNQKPIAWKTGTSYGHKDAWAVGTTPEWTIVVWVGNFDGESNKGLAGMKSAGPLMFNILNVLPVSSSKRWFEPDPKDFVEVKLCAQTGFYAGGSCTEVVLSKVPTNMKPMRICPYHQTLVVNHDHNYVVCSRCWTTDHQEMNVLKYPPDVNYYLWQNGGIVETLHEHNPACDVRQERDILKIIYPLDRANLFVTKDFDGSYQPVISRLATQFPEREVFWYLDDHYLGSTIRKPSLLLHLKSGEHELSVVDSEGNRDLVKFNVMLR